MIIKGNTVGHPLADPRKGLAMAGAIHMGGHALTGLKAPTQDSDAATKAYAESYADSLHKLFTVAVPGSLWSASAPYTQSVAVEGILASDHPHYGVVYSQAALAEKEAFAMIDDLDTADGRITFTCLEEKPERDLTILLEVNR